MDLQIADDAITIVALDKYGEWDEERHNLIQRNLKEDVRVYFGRVEGASALVDSNGDTISALDGVSATVVYDEDSITFEDFQDEDGNSLDEDTYMEYVLSIQHGLIDAMLDGDYLMVHSDGTKLTAGDEEDYEDEYTAGEFYLSNGVSEDDVYEILDIVPYWNSTPVYEAFDVVLPAEICSYKNVEAYYITAPFTMGDLMHNKAIWGWTLTSDSGEPSSIEVCQAVNDVNLDEMEEIVAYRNTSEGYEYGDIAYERIDFSKTIVPNTYTYYNTLLVPFICFGLRNNDDENAVLSSLQVLYTKPSGTFGGSR